MANNSEVAIAWATGADNKNYGSHMSHGHGKLFSYHTVIGEVGVVGEESIYVVQTASYSSSTSHHQAHMERTLLSENKFEYLPGCFVYNWGGFYLEDKEFKKDDLLQVAKNHIVKTLLDIAKLTVSRSIKDERNISWKYMKKAQELMRITQCSWETIMTQDFYRSIGRYRNFTNLDLTKEMVYKLIEVYMEHPLAISLQKDVNYILGENVYNHYVERTKRQRTAIQNREIREFEVKNKLGAA